MDFYFNVSNNIKLDNKIMIVGDEKINEINSKFDHDKLIEKSIK